MLHDQHREGEHGWHLQHFCFPHYFVAIIKDPVLLCSMLVQQYTCFRTNKQKRKTNQQTPQKTTKTNTNNKNNYTSTEDVAILISLNKTSLGVNQNGTRSSPPPPPPSTFVQIQMSNWRNKKRFNRKVAWYLRHFNHFSFKCFYFVVAETMHNQSKITTTIRELCSSFCFIACYCWK